MSHAEYELDVADHWKKVKEPNPEDGGWESRQYSDYTYSIHTYSITGRTPGLAGLFQEGPTTLVEGVEKKPKKKKKSDEF